jgi:myosin I
LDDTCKTMHGTKASMDVDKKFLDSARQVHASHAHFRPLPNAFIVKHYAGDVQYDLGKLGDSNKDALDNDLLRVVKSSSDKLLLHLFRQLEVVNPEDSSSSGGAGGRRSPAPSEKVPSAGTRIRQQCQLLVTALMECSPHYVRWYVSFFVLHCCNLFF